MYLRRLGPIDEGVASVEVLAAYSKSKAVSIVPRASAYPGADLDIYVTAKLVGYAPPDSVIGDVVPRLQATFRVHIRGRLRITEFPPLEARAEVVKVVWQREIEPEARVVRRKLRPCR
jgi:hypothetical protein